MIPLVIILFAVLSLLVYLRKRTGIAKTLPPELDCALPIIGHTHLFLSPASDDMLFLEELATAWTEKVGGVGRVHFGPFTLIVLTDPDDGYTAMAEGLSKNSFPYELFREEAEYGLFTEENEAVWRPERKALNHAFNPQMIDTLIPLFNKGSRELVTAMEKEVGQHNFDQRSYMKEITILNIGRTIFGDLCEETSLKTTLITFKDYFDDILDSYAMRMTNFLYYSKYIYQWTDNSKMIHQIIGNVYKWISIMIAKHKEERGKRTANNSNQIPKKNLKNFLEILFDLHDQGRFTERGIKTHIINMIAGGYHTIAFSLAVTLTLIGSYEEVQDRLHAELQEVLGDSDRDITKEDLTKLIYLDAVVKETLRLYPIAPLIPRYTKREIKLKNYTIPANTHICLSTTGINRHRMWGKDRDVFNPSRWLDGSVPNHPHAFATFSFGKRNCIGRNFAMQMMKICLAHLLRAYRIHGDIRRTQFKADLTLCPRSGHEISIERRNKMSHHK